MKESVAQSNITLSQMSRLWPLMPLLVMMLLSPMMAAFGNTDTDSCNIKTNGQYPKQAHYFYYHDQNLPIIIEDSYHLSHLITNRILKILLQQIAGYQNVEIQHCQTYDNQNITALLDRVSGRTASEHCQAPRVNTGTVPDTMVNLEAWMVAGFDKGPWLDTGRLVDAGPLGPQGRMGWFLPTFTVEQFWSKGQNVVDHWRALQITRLSRRFSWWGREELEKISPDYRMEAYRNPKCRENLKGRRRNCATLLAGYRGVDAGVLQSQIQSLNLYVDIVWLGDLLAQFVNDRVSAGQSVLFFSWHPSTLIASGMFTRINFPDTHTNHKDAPVDCDFPVNQLTKVLWGPLKTGAPEAFHIISKMSFSDLEYDQLIANSSQHSDFSTGQVACRWVKDNAEKWDKWLPNSLREKPKIYLGGLFPLTGKSWSQQGLVEGAKLAIDLVNLDVTTLPNHTLELLVNDTQCEYDVAMSQFISLVQRSPPIAGILGPGCSDPAQRIAALSKHFNMMMVSYGAEAEALSDREKYPYFFRTVPPVQHFTYIYQDLFRELGWGVVGALAEGGQELPEYHLTLQDRLQRHGISLVVKRKFLNDTQTPDIPQILKEFKAQNVRVIIVDVFSKVARELMCEAYKQKMTAYEGYVWFLPSWYPKDWSDVDYYNSVPNHWEPQAHQENVPCSTAEVERAIEGHFVLSKSVAGKPHEKVVGGITVHQYKEAYARRCGEAFVEESTFASFVYDAVWVYAKGIDALLRKNDGALETINTKNTASAFRSIISKLSFKGVSGRIEFEGSDRHADLIILQVFSNETRQIGQYSHGSVGLGEKPVLQLDSSKIRWLSPMGPVKEELVSSSDECPIESFRAQLGVDCTIASVIVIVIACFGFIIIVIVFPIVMKYRCDAKVKKLRAQHERIKELGLLKDEYSHILTVDDWEIPRKDVVLNRELGEGAFGTVMGGEMHKEKEGWVSVAVKTLKLHHTMEEKKKKIQEGHEIALYPFGCQPKWCLIFPCSELKSSHQEESSSCGATLFLMITLQLDFFSEVDMMKCFAHENIVQLWGVCTRKEPMYAVMEFMLHGDLKTYLLSRRSLVGQGVKEAEDVKAENLTQMAVDVAKGLSYLHALKYVHRDLACRNCLVHANKTVKIGDFGMTRHISSTDYYRFSRKGMLPVRWTAPEALKDGIYSAKSDIWSYGVLVFEIVTFGSFPYQGYSNKEVLDFVGRGCQIMLPDKCSDALKSFIRWCMSTDPGYRPDLDDILSYLNYSPAFLAPCLDAPTTSVVHEDTDSLEINLPAGPVFPPANHSTVSSVPSSFLTQPDHRNLTGQGKLKDKKKTFSVPGLASLGKSTKSSVARSPVSSSRSSSLCSGTLLSNSVCGLHSCGIGGGWGGNNSPGDEDEGVDRDDAAATTSATLESDDIEMLQQDNQHRRELVCNVDFEINGVTHRTSISSDHRRYSFGAGSEKGDMSSGYVSQNSKGESKQICQTITSL